MNENLTPEMLKKAKAAASAEELLALAKENGITMTAEKADNYFAKLHPKTKELRDDELDNVAGGCGGQYIKGDPLTKCVRCDKYERKEGNTNASEDCHSCRFLLLTYDGSNAYCTVNYQ